MATRASNLGKKAPEDELLDELHRVADIVGGKPDADDIDEHGKWSNSTYYNRWDTWRDVLEAANLYETEHDVLRQIVEGNNGEVRTSEAEQFLTDMWNFDVAIDETARDLGYEVNEQRIVDPNAF